MKSVLLFLLWVVPTYVLALDPGRSVSQYGIRQYRLEDGLPQSTVQAILQTRDGFLWFGTEDGLSRFDGRRFVNSTHVSLFVTDLVEDLDGSIWIATNGVGLVKYDRETYFFVSDQEGLIGRRTTSLVCDRRNQIWVGTEQGLFVGNEQGFEAITWDFGKGGVVDLEVSKDGRIYVVSRSGLFLVEERSVVEVDIKGQFGEVFIGLVYRDRADRVWVTHSRGISRVEGESLIEDPMSNSMGNYVTTVMLQDRDGQFWLGAFESLRRIVGQTTDVVTSLKGVEIDTINAIYEDREGNLWIGTGNDGVFQLRNTPFIAYGVQEGLSDAMAFPVFEDRQGDIWVGLDDGKLNRIGESGVAHFTPGKRAGSVTSIDQAPDGTIYLGAGFGLYRLKGEQVELVSHPELDQDSIWALCFDRAGVLWIGSVSGGVYRLQGETWTQYGSDSGLQSLIVPAIIEDRLGRIWVGTDGGGLHRLDGDTFVPFGIAEGLEHLTITSLLEDRRGIIWVSTHGGGIYRFENGRFKAHHMSDGLPANLIYSIIEDSDDNLWCSSTRGIFRLRRLDLDAFALGHLSVIPYELYGTHDGLRSVECNGGVQRCAITGRDGNLWFSTIAGLARVDPNRLYRNPTPPPIIVDSLSYADQTVANPEQGLTLAPGIRQFQADFSALCFTNPARVTYAYLLEGFDSDWVDAGERSTAIYTNVPPGNYTLRARANNGSNVWSHSEARVFIRLEPFFYQTAVFRFLVAVACGLLIFGLYVWRVRAARARERDLKRLVAERTQDLWKVTHKLKDANARLERMSFTDSLTGVANRRRFETVIEGEWRRAMRNQTSISILMIDIDFFKSYNDSYGHQSGDECLKRVASALADLLQRPSDLIARYGGEEFIVALPDTDAEGASVVAETMRTCVVNLNIEHQESKILPYVSISIGVSSTVPQSDSTWDGLIDRADQALYQSKHLGRNRVERLEFA